MNVRSPQYRVRYLHIFIGVFHTVQVSHVLHHSVAVIHPKKGINLNHYVMQKRTDNAPLDLQSFIQYILPTLLKVSCNDSNCPQVFYKPFQLLLKVPKLADRISIGRHQVICT